LNSPDLGSEPAPDESSDEPAIETTIDLRPDLSALGMLEHERGVVEDSYENRQVLRSNSYSWDAVYSQTGQPTGLITARSPEMARERRLLSIQDKKPLLLDPRDNNSDYLIGLDLLVDETATRITPPWVVGATRKWVEEQDRGGPTSAKRAPAVRPHRCKTVKSDGIRCMLWSSGRIKDDGLCRVHLRSVRKPGEDIERARRKLIQSAPYAVDVLEQMMESAESEQVRLKASTEILDRSGLRAGMDLNIDVEVTEGRSPAQIVQERLARLASGIKRTEEPEDIVDAEVIDTSPAAAAEQPNKEAEEKTEAVTEEIFTPDEEDGVQTSADFDDEEMKDM